MSDQGGCADTHAANGSSGLAIEPLLGDQHYICQAFKLHDQIGDIAAHTKERPACSTNLAHAKASRPTGARMRTSTAAASVAIAVAEQGSFAHRR